LKRHGFSRACLSNTPSKFAARSQQFLQACVQSDLEQDAPVSHTTAKSGQALQFADVAWQRIFLHRCQRAMMRAYQRPESA
jgi:hypothetical protein